MRCAIYARYSTDRQSEMSIRDQVQAAATYAKAQGWIVVATHTDSEQSGSTPVALRPGGKGLLADVMAKRFDILLVEDLSRLSRRVAESESLIHRLESRGIRIVGMSDSYDTRSKGRKVMRIARGMFNEIYIDDVRDKTHRGLVGNMNRGMSAGGRSYGYTSLKTAVGYQLTVNQEEAAHVRWVFEQIDAGHSPRWIVHQLNARGVPSARGSTWAVSAVAGSTQRGLGMLNNQLYIGMHIWNRSQWVKDPDTGKRRRVARPEAEWINRQDESLRIVSQELWDRVQARIQGATQPGRGGKGGVHRTLFGGLIRCGVCGGPVIAVNTLRYGCGIHKDRGSAVCANNRTLARETMDARLLTTVREELLQPDLLPIVKAEVKRLMAVHSRTARMSNTDTRKRLQEVESQIGNLVAALASVGFSPAVATALKAAEAEKDELQAALGTTMPKNAVLAIDDVEARYKRLLMRLRSALDDEDRAAVREMLHQLMGQMTFAPAGDDVAIGFDEPAERLLYATAGESLGLVAGAGFEPTTFGL